MGARWIAMALLVAGCSSPPGHEATENSAASGPDVGVAHVAGIALQYQYGFRLPAQHIGALQEAHARQCEALTVERCRITGMAYDVGRDRRITASLQFKLAPDIARRFGKQGVDTVVKGGGMLVSAAIDSEEVGDAIAAADREAVAIVQERKEIAGQLAKAGLGSAERASLQRRLADLSDDSRQNQDVTAKAAAKLAGTPMTFTYVSGAVDPGLTDGPIVGAVKDGWAIVVSGLAIIVMLLISITPWLLTAGLLLWLWRRFAGRLGLSSKSEE